MTSPPDVRDPPVRHVARGLQLVRGALVIATLLVLLLAARGCRILGRRSRLVARVEQTWSDLWMR